MPIKVTIWNEFVHERRDEEIRRVYPEGIHMALKEELSPDTELSIRTATLDMPGQGLSEEILRDTDVLIWWGHIAHDEVSEETAEMVAKHVRLGMGLMVLHSGHHSKPFKKLLGTSCNLCWREIGERERVWVIDPTHPICKGLGRSFELPHEEMYGERFDIPAPDELLMLGWYQGGEVFRSGCVFKRGLGKIFYFQPGHESYPTYHIPEVVTVLRNAVHYLSPVCREEDPGPFGAPLVDPAESGILEAYGIQGSLAEKFKERVQARIAQEEKEKQG